MRLHSRLVLGLCGVSLAAATSVFAAPPDGYASAGMPVSSAMPSSGASAPGLDAMPPAGAAPAHKHKGLFGWRHCVECQRALAKRQSGVDIPPPPGFANDPTAHVHGVGVTVANCPRCKSLGVVAGAVVSERAEAPGFAVMDGSANDRPGFAVVNGEGNQADPTPIGVARAGQTPWASGRMAAAGPGPGYDPAVVPSSIPPAQVGVPGPGHDRPHIIGHLFGVSQMRRDMREHREKRMETGPAHASIRYDQQENAVSELPASMVFDKGSR
jgi:hypothetical protein